jgi:hypothetical protein
MVFVLRATFVDIMYLCVGKVLFEILFIGLDSSQSTKPLIF